MKRTIATVLLVAAVLGAVVFAVLNRNKKPYESVAIATAETGERYEIETSSQKTYKPDDRYKAGPRTTEAASYGDSKVADLCELMKNITGTWVRPSFAKVEDFFGDGFYNSYMGYEISYQDYKQGEKIYNYYNYLQASLEDLSFNRFIFTANEEYGNLYKVECINSNSKHDNSLKPSPFSKEEMMDYYSRLEKELTKVFGNPTSSEPVNKEKGGPAFSEYKVNEECTFRVELRHSAGSQYVSLSCINNVERKHFLIHDDSDLPDEDFEKDNYYKPAGEGDIVTDKETGYQYVKNQLLVSFKLGTPNDMEKMNEICKEIGAKVVGYLKTTSDFQIEFDRDLTCKELIKIGKELEEKYYFISSAHLNYAAEGDYLD